MRLSDAERKQVEAAFEAAQALTSAPLGCVFAAASGDYVIPPLLGSGLLTLLTPWPLILFTGLSAERIFGAQLLVCLVTLGIFSLPLVRVALTPLHMRRAAAHRAALVQFALRGFDRAPDNDGVLLYVSLAERYVRVVADSNAERAVGAGPWKALVDQLTRDLAQGNLEQSLQKAASRLAELMAPQFPPQPGQAGKGQRFHVV